MNEPTEMELKYLVKNNFDLSDLIPSRIIPLNDSKSLSAFFKPITFPLSSMPI